MHNAGSPGFASVCAMTLRAYVGQSQDGGFRELTLDGEIEVLSVGHLVMNIVSGEIGHGLVRSETERLVHRAPRNRSDEGELLTPLRRRPVITTAEGFLEQDGLRTRMVQAERSISHFVEEIQILHR